jgi:prepilin-type N-terminal cleavage/methylation domain-containing protein
MRKEKGFTLVELLVAMAISGIVVAAVYTAFVTQQKSYTVQNQVAETQQNARVGLDLIAREVRMAGYGQPAWSMNADTDGGCFGLCHTVTDPVTVVDGGASPDRITVIGCFDTAPGTLSVAASMGNTALTLQNADEASKFNTTTKNSIFIGGFENAKVTNISGRTLTIDIDPTTSGNQGLARSYSTGAEVNLVRAITYYVEDDTLRRDENTGAGGQPLAENIEDLQLTYANKLANISVLARSREIDPTYRDATHGDHYRRRTLISNVNVRSLLYQVEEK